MAYFARPQSRSAAVKIVAPPSDVGQDDAAAQKAQSKKDSTQRQCRNILIYGSCKFEGKGCIYYHPPRTDASHSAPPAEVPATPTLSAQAVNAPVFVPKTVSRGVASPKPESPSSPPPSMSTEYHDHDPYDPYAYPGSNGDIHPEHMTEGLDGQMQSLGVNEYDANVENGQMFMHSEYNDVNGMEAYYQPSQPTFVRQPLHYHLYTAPLPHVLSHNFFISDNVREDLQRRAETIHTAPAPGLALPEELQGYHSLVPLEYIAGERRKFGNWYSTVYRATKIADGRAYALRRIENYRLIHQNAFSPIESWSQIRHPNIISVREAFTTRAFNDSSLVVAYDYHPNAQTLFDAHIKPKAPTFHNGRMQTQSSLVPERTIWTYVVQIANAIKATHDAGLAVRVIDATKVLVTGQNRIRISSCGIVDVLAFDTISDISRLQQEDLVAFGKLVFALCCNNIAAANNLAKYRETMSRHYSADLLNVALWLMSSVPHKIVGQLFDMIGSRLLTEMDAMQLAADQLENELMKELENARLVRLLCKFGFINERPEFDREPRWSETGDRYIIKLFRDFVFHQVDENGKPVVNLSHVLTCLNKLDTGTDERIMLVSRDEQSCLVVSYKEVKSCIEGAFNDLARGSSR